MNNVHVVNINVASVDEFNVDVYILMPSFIFTEIEEEYTVSVYPRGK